MFGLQSRPPENSLYKAPKQSKTKPGCLISIVIVFVLLSWAVRSPGGRLSISAPQTVYQTVQWFLMTTDI